MRSLSRCVMLLRRRRTQNAVSNATLLQRAANSAGRRPEKMCKFLPGHTNGMPPKKSPTSFDDVGLLKVIRAAVFAGLQRPAFAILALDVLIQVWKIGANEVLRIPLNPLTFASSDCEVAHQNSFRQTTGVAKIGHRAWLVVSAASFDEFHLFRSSLLPLKGIRGID